MCVAFTMISLLYFDVLVANAVYSNSTYNYHDYANGVYSYYAVDHSDPHPANIHTSVTAKAFNSYGDLNGTASATGNLSCSATSYPGPGVSQCINVSSLSNSKVTFTDTLAE